MKWCILPLLSHYGAVIGTELLGNSEALQDEDENCTFESFLDWHAHASVERFINLTCHISGIHPSL